MGPPAAPAWPSPCGTGGAGAVTRPCPSPGSGPDGSAGSLGAAWSRCSASFGSSVAGSASGAVVSSRASAWGSARGGAAWPFPPPPSSISASSVPTPTVSPSWTLISTSVPARGDGTSVSTLSVEISNSGPSRSTVAPCCFSHFVMVPSTTVSPSCGMVTAVATVNLLVESQFRLPFRELLDGFDDGLDLRDVGVLQRRRERHRHVGRGDPDDRGVQEIEALLCDDRADLGSDPKRLVALVQHDRSRRLLDRPEDGVDVHGPDRAQVEDLYGDPVLLQLVGGLKGLVDHRSVRDDT